MEDKLTPEEQKTLLRLAREAIEHGVKGEHSAAFGFIRSDAAPAARMAPPSSH